MKYIHWGGELGEGRTDFLVWDTQFESETFFEDAEMITMELDGILFIESKVENTVSYVYDFDTVLFYDFDVQLGDTLKLRIFSPFTEDLGYRYCDITGPSYNDDSISLVLTTLDTLDSDIGMRKLWKFDEWIGEGSIYKCRSRTWIEGVGWLENPFASARLSADRIFWGLECYYYNGEHVAVGNNLNGPCTPVGSSEPIQSRIRVFPNPTSDWLYTVSEEHSVFRLYDALGRKVLEDSESPIDVSHLRAGVYFLGVGNRMEKVIIE